MELSTITRHPCNHHYILLAPGAERMGVPHLHGRRYSERGIATLVHQKGAESFNYEPPQMRQDIEALVRKWIGTRKDGQERLACQQ